MPTLVIHTSDARARKGRKSFESVLDDGIGDGYALSKGQYRRLENGDPVVLLRKDRNKRRAEGRLVELVATGRTTPQGLQRYDVYIEDLKRVEYRPEPLNHYGVNVI